MADDRSGKYPDISGVFNIDDSEVPTNVILKKQSETEKSAAGPVLFRQPETAYRPQPAEAPSRRPAPEPETRRPAANTYDRPAAASREPILLRQPNGEDARRQQQVAQAERQRRLEEKRRARRRTVMIHRGILLGALAVLLVILLAAVLHKPTPQVLIDRVKEATVEASFTVEAALIQDPAGTGEDRLYAVAVLSEAEAAAAQEGGKATLVYPEDKTVTGIVSSVLEEPADSTLLETLGTLLPELTVPAEGLTLAVILPDDPAAVEGGDVVSAQIVTETSRQVLTVPRGALRADGSEVIVWVYNTKGMTKKLERRVVTVGLLSDTNAEIASGLETGEAVVIGSTLGPESLKNGMKVKLAKTDE